MPSRINVAFILLTIRLCSPTRLSLLAVGPLGIFVLGSRDRHHLAVISLAAQPAEKGALEQLGVETVGLGAPVLARHGYARCVDNVGLDVARLEANAPARSRHGRPRKRQQVRLIRCPAFTASSRHRCSNFSNALSSAASFFNGWRARRQAQCQRRASSTGSIRQRRSAYWRPDRGDLAISSDRYTSAWGAPSVHISNTMDAISSPPPHSISLGGLRTPAPVYPAPPSWGRHPQAFETWSAVRPGCRLQKRVVFPEMLVAHKGLGRKMPPINSSC